MKLSGLSRNSDAARSVQRELLSLGDPLVARLDAVLANGEVEATLLVDALGTVAGTKVGIRQAQGIGGRDSLALAVEGGERAFASRPGDVIAFSSAYAEGGIAIVGPVSAREHDGLAGRVQVMTAMARASQSRITGKGPSQLLTIADGSGAKVARTIDAVLGALREASARDWPGGSAGLIMRDRSGNTAEYFLGFDRDEAYLAQELEAEGTLAESALEVIPAWRVPMGRDQIPREINPAGEPTKGHSGPVTRLFEHPSLKGRQGFRPCLIIACDEDEWAFKARTGKRHRVIAGIQPITRMQPVAADRLPSSKRDFGGRAYGIVTLRDAAAMDAVAKERAARRPATPDPEPRAGAAGRDDDEDRIPRRGLPLMRR